MLAFITDTGARGTINFHYDVPAGRSPTVTCSGRTFQVHSGQAEMLDPASLTGSRTEEIEIHNPDLEGYLRVAHTNPPRTVRVYPDYLLSIEYHALPSVTLLQCRNVTDLVLMFDRRERVPDPLSHPNVIFTTVEMGFARGQGDKPLGWGTNRGTSELTRARGSAT
jgi:hypothetical protein